MNSVRQATMTAVAATLGISAIFSSSTVAAGPCHQIARDVECCTTHPGYEVSCPGTTPCIMTFDVTTTNPLVDDAVIAAAGWCIDSLTTQVLGTNCTGYIPICEAGVCIVGPPANWGCYSYSPNGPTDCPVPGC